MINVSELTDIELNRAMIWLYPEQYSVSRCPESTWYWAGMLRLDYLTDWNLTMPLAVENELTTINELGYCWAGTDVSAWDGPCIYMENDVINKNPLRAICEVLVMIKLEEG